MFSVNSLPFQFYSLLKETAIINQPDLYLLYWRQYLPYQPHDTVSIVHKKSYIIHKSINSLEVSFPFIP